MKNKKYIQIAEEFLKAKKGYLKKSDEFVSNILSVPKEAVKEAKNRLKSNNLIMDKLPIKRLFFDIETSYCKGWFWRPGYNQTITYEQIDEESAIICICYKWEGDNNIYSIQWNKGDDKQLLEKFAIILKQADEVIAHNGDKFDIAFFKSRCIYHNIEAFQKVKSIDTLLISRGGFKFNSNRLDYLGKYMNLGGKVDTGGIQLWHDIIKNNSKEAMNKMIEYCKGDVELLENVFHKLEPWVGVKTHVAILNGGNKCDCPKCGSNSYNKNGITITSTGVIKQRVKCKNCNYEYTVLKTQYDKLNK